MRSDDFSPPVAPCGFYFALKDHSVKPVLQALLLADKIYSDDGTGKKIIAGTFSKLVIVNQTLKVEEGTPARLAVPSGGMKAGSPFAYLSVTDVSTETQLTLRYVHLSDEEIQVVFQTELTVKSSDRLKTIEIVLPLPELPVVKGVFALEVLCESELLGSHRVIVEEQEIPREVD